MQIALRALPLVTVLWAVFWAALWAGVSGAWADGTFFQVDTSKDTAAGVAVVEHGRAEVLVAKSNWTGGYKWTGSSTWKFEKTLGGMPVNIRVGPVLQFSTYSGWQSGLTAGFESWNTRKWGALYLQSNLTSIDGNYFSMIQFNHKSGFSAAFEVMGNDARYFDEAVEVDYRIPNTPIGLRLGRKLHAQETYFGFLINTF